MSRLGKLPIAIPAGVEAKLADKKLSIKGKLGQLELALTDEVKVSIDNNIIHVVPVSDTARSRAMWGTTRSNLNNMVKGVTEGYVIRLEINGVGFKCAVKGNAVVISLGYSHDIRYLLPMGVTAVAEKPTLLVISGYDKQKVGQIAAEIMALRAYDPYKGKGIFPEGKPQRRKEGKKK